MIAVYTITIDGAAYQGEDPDHEYDASGGDLGTSFHSYNSYSALNELLIGPGEPKRISGERGLRGEIERIARRIKDGRISPRQIMITVECGADSEFPSMGIACK